MQVDIQQTSKEAHHMNITSSSVATNRVLKELSCWTTLKVSWLAAGWLHHHLQTTDDQVVFKYKHRHTIHN